jgi:hypothetical protein
MSLPISIDSPSAIAAFRQLALGARPSFPAGGHFIYQREGYDSLYYRGWALRHSNGKTGKYEQYTYEASDTLRAWAATQSLRTFDDALAGCDTAKEIRNLRRRQRRAETATYARPVPSVASVQHQLLVEAQGPGVTVNEDGEASSRGLTAWYVREFCRLNSLKVA